MTLNQRFAVFCAKKCLHLWKAPTVVIEWLNNPQAETAYKAANATVYSAYKAANRAEEVSYAAGRSAAYTVARGTAADIAHSAAKHASRALDTTEGNLRQQFVATWSEEDLKTEDPDWIEYATAELFERAA